MKRRSEFEIHINILEKLLYNQLKLKYTQLMQKSNISNLKLKNKLLPKLMKRGLISKISSDTYYKITNKGIDRYVKLKIADALFKLENE